MRTKSCITRLFVSSPNPSEGKSVTVANLAASMAETLALAVVKNNLS